MYNFFLYFCSRKILEVSGPLSIDISQCDRFNPATGSRKNYCFFQPQCQPQREHIIMNRWTGKWEDVCPEPMESIIEPSRKIRGISIKWRVFSRFRKILPDQSVAGDIGIRSLKDQFGLPNTEVSKRLLRFDRWPSNSYLFLQKYRFFKVVLNRAVLYYEIGNKISYGNNRVRIICNEQSIEINIFLSRITHNFEIYR